MLRQQGRGLLRQGDELQLLQGLRAGKDLDIFHHQQFIARRFRPDITYREGLNGAGIFAGRGVRGGDLHRGRAAAAVCCPYGQQDMAPLRSALSEGYGGACDRDLGSGGVNSGQNSSNSFQLTFLLLRHPMRRPTDPCRGIVRSR